ncbi:MAG: 50S ribosomal protein L4 [Candidatus Pacebacteria bacterium]|nr:50S ribosomal protein L4 [Candidatus Paceibacterota bacterium]
MATTTKAPTKKTVAKKAPAKRATKAAVASDGAMEAKIFNASGKSAGTIALPPELFSAPWNADLVHQVYVGMRANARPTVANTKFRGEVSGGGKKPWKQKGTGRARHGSTRSPIWRHGGITHGPRAERDFSVKINRKMRLAALISVLSKKAKDGEIIFVDKLSFAAPKTSEAKAALVAIAQGAGVPTLATKLNNAAIIAFSKKDTTAEKSFRNIGSVISEEIRNLNTVDLLDKRFLVIENPTEAFEILMARLSTKASQ